MANNTKVTVAGFAKTQMAVIDNTGYLIGGALTLAAGSDSGMLRLDASQNASPQLGEPEILQIPGDDGVVDVFQFAPNALPVFDLQLGTIDFGSRALAEGTSTVDEGDLTMLAVQPKDPVYPNLCFLLTQRSGIRDAGSVGLKAYTHFLISKGIAAPLETDSIQTGANASSDRLRVTGNNTDTLPWGETVTSAGFGTTELPGVRINSDYLLSMHAFTGNNSLDNFTLDYTPAAASGAKVQVWEDGVKLAYTTDYTVTGTTLTFEAGSIPGSGAKVVVLYEHS